MEIKCTVGEIDSKLLKWAGVSDLWEELELDYIGSPREDIVPLVPEIEIFIDLPELSGWDNIDPDSHNAAITISSEMKARKRFIAAIKRFARENKSLLREKTTSYPTISVDGESDEGDMLIHTDAKAFRKK